MLKKSFCLILSVIMMISIFTVFPLSASADDFPDTGCEHDWEWQYNDESHWQYCPNCGVYTRTREHEKGAVKAEVSIVGEPVVIDGEETDVLLVTVFDECPTCQHKAPIKAYTVTHSYDLSLYNIAKRRKAVITKSANAIYMEGSYANSEMVFWDGDVLRKNSDGYYDHPDYTKEQGSVIIHFDSKFLAQTDDGDYELIVLNGDEFTVMTVTMENHFLVNISEKDFDEYPTISAYDYTTIIKNYENHNAEIIRCDLDDILPLLGDADSDRSVTIVDATLMQRKLAEISAGAFDISVIDIDGDGALTIIDVTVLQRWLADFPVSREIARPVPGYDVRIE